MASTGIRELKDHFESLHSQDRIGERFAVTASATGSAGRYAALVAEGVIRPASDAGDPLDGWPDIRMAPGTAARLIDEDRDEA